MVPRAAPILHTESSCGWGGQEIRILEESKALLRRGHEVAIACPTESELFRRAPEWGIPVIPTPIARRSVAALGAIHRLLAGHRHGIINTHSSTDSWLVSFASLATRRRPAIVRTRHISAPISRSPASAWLYRRAADHVVTTGEALRIALMEATGMPGHRVTSVPTGIDPSRFQPRDPREARARVGLERESPLMGIVATVRSWKGHIFLLEAFAHCKLNGWKLAVVGDGPSLGAAVDRARALGISDRVVFAGQQSNPEVWLQAMDIVCQPSYANEGVSQAVLQAMMTGRPVIATPVGATQEAVRHGETGIIVPPSDSESLASAIRELAESPAKRAALGARGRAVALAEFSVERMADRMEAVFMKALQRRRGGRPTA
ncbi:MAG: glycosyltransferase family 4 protein [Phycisphaerales bacterium]|nr:glycosyltransferase family 4 protein [Phycisphaerales bacterium]